jgi:hypothetical protein
MFDTSAQKHDPEVLAVFPVEGEVGLQHMNQKLVTLQGQTGDLSKLFFQKAHAFAHYGNVEIFLALKIEIDRAFCQTAPAGDLLNRGGHETFLEKDLSCGFEDGFPTFGLFFLAPEGGRRLTIIHNMTLSH